MEKKLFDYINNNNDTSFLKIKSDVQKIFSPEFAEFTDKIFTKYDNIIEKVNELYKNLSEDINRDTEKILAIEEIIKTNIGKYETNEIERISYFTRKAILDDLSSNELKLKLERIGGRVANYSNTIARSQIAGYGRESKNTKAEIGGVLYAEYVGNITENTRTFCIERLSGTSPRGDNHYHINEINELNNGPRQLKPVITYCGGWNCNHDWEWDPFYKADK